MKPNTKILKSRQSFTAQLPLPPLNKINLLLLNTRLTPLQHFFKINNTNFGGEEQGQTKKYLSITIQDHDLSFNVFTNGKIVGWHCINHKGVQNLLDFFYYEHCFNCLEEVKL